MKEPLRTMKYDMLQTGDTFHSRSRKIHASIIAYATAWGDSKSGRKRARDAVKDKGYPNHTGNVLVSWGQRYPVEASPHGYVRGSFDDYCTKDAQIVSMYRWRGFEDERVRNHAAAILERWARKATRPKYDLWGAIASSRLGVTLMPWLRNRSARLFCSEGCVYLHVMCGYCDGVLMDPTSGLDAVQAKVNRYRSILPGSMNPYDVEQWQERTPVQFTKLSDFYAPLR